jgi:hypothetical protein
MIFKSPPTLFALCMAVFFMVTACTKKALPISDKASLPEKFKNILIHEGSGFTGPCEPSICVSPVNPDWVVAGSVLDNLYFSKDGGATWSVDRLKSSFGVYGDPVVIIDRKGTIHYAHLSNPKGRAYSSPEFLDRIVISLQPMVCVFGRQLPPSDQSKDHDKHWLAVDPKDNALLMSWTEFDKYGSKEEKDKSRILFSVSHDGAKTWSPA